VKDAFTMGKVVRLNLNQTFNACFEAISPRCDLDTPKTFGGIDGKVIDYDLFQDNSVLVISSPTYQNMPPFNW